MNRCRPSLFILALLALAGGGVERLAAAPPDSAYRLQLQALETGDTQQRDRAARALGARPIEVDRTVPALLKVMLEERNNTVIASARSSLIGIGKPAVPHIVAAMQEARADRLRELVVVLAAIGGDARAAVPRLQELHASPDPRLRKCVAFALNSIQPGSATKDTPPEMRETEATEAVTSAADEERIEVPIRVPYPSADRADGKSPVTRAEFLPLVEEPVERASREEDEAEIVRVAAALPLDSVARDDTERSTPEPVPLPASATTAPVSRQQTEPPPPVRAAVPNNRAPSESYWTTVFGFLANYRQGLIGALKWTGFCYAVWLLVFVMVPARCVEFDLWLRYSRRSIGGRVLWCWAQPVRMLLFLPWLCRLRFATSAWIESRAETIVNQFWTREEVQRNAGYVSAPVRVNGAMHESLTANNLQCLRRRKAEVACIAGPAGSGKRSLAAAIAWLAASGQLGGRRLLPVFLRPGMNVAESIREQVQCLLGCPDEESARYESLLRRIEAGFILPVADLCDNSIAGGQFLDELRGQADSQTIVAVVPEWRPNPQSADILLEPAPPEGESLHRFVNDYLWRWECKPHPGDAELSELCAQFLSLRTAGPLLMTTLTAFLDVFLRCGKKVADWNPPTSVVELLRRYVEWRLAQAAGTGFTVEELRQDIAELAKMSTAKAFRPQPVRYEAALKRLEGWNAAHRLAFLDERLELIDGRRGETGTVRFRSEHLAVRLAAADRLAALDLNEARWSSLLQQLRVAALDSKANVKSFALALFDCCLESRAMRPDSVLDELGRLAELDAERVQRDLEIQQLNAALFQLGNADRPLRLASLRRLRRLAPGSKRAMSAMIDSLTADDAELRTLSSELLRDLGAAAVGPLCERLHGMDADARLAIAELLRSMGPSANAAALSLLELLADGNDTVRAAAVTAIATVAPDRLRPLVGLLREESAEFRAASVEAFGLLGSTAEDVVELIVPLLDDEAAAVRLSAVTALGRIGLASVDVVTGLIKALVAEEEEVRLAAGASLAQLRGVPDVDNDRGRMRNSWRRGAAVPASRAA